MNKEVLQCLESLGIRLLLSMREPSTACSREALKIKQNLKLFKFLLQDTTEIKIEEPLKHRSYQVTEMLNIENIESELFFHRLLARLVSFPTPNQTPSHRNLQQKKNYGVIGTNKHRMRSKSTHERASLTKLHMLDRDLANGGPWYKLSLATSTQRRSPLFSTLSFPTSQYNILFFMLELN